MICKICNKKIHYCTNCDYDMYCSAGYCGKECYELSEEWITFSENMKNFWDTLTDEQKSELWALWDNGIFNDDKFENFLNEIIKCPDAENDK